MQAERGFILFRIGKSSPRKSLIEKRNLKIVFAVIEYDIRLQYTQKGKPSHAIHHLIQQFISIPLFNTTGNAYFTRLIPKSICT
jgi:hypothetical protein